MTNREEEVSKDEALAEARIRMESAIRHMDVVEGSMEPFDAEKNREQKRSLRETIELIERAEE